MVDAAPDADAELLLLLLLAGGCCCGGGCCCCGWCGGASVAALHRRLCLVGVLPAVVQLAGPERECLNSAALAPGSLLPPTRVLAGPMAGRGCVCCVCSMLRPDGQEWRMPPMKVRGLGASPLKDAPLKSKPGCCSTSGPRLQADTGERLRLEQAARLRLEALQHQALLLLLLCHRVHLVASEQGGPRLPLRWGRPAQPDGRCTGPRHAVGRPPPAAWPAGW